MSAPSRGIRTRRAVRTTAVVLAALAAALAATVWLAGRQWQSGTRALVARLHEAPAPASRPAFSERDLASLPAPVARYLKAVLREGQPLPRRVDLAWEGEMLLRPPDGWSPFTAAQSVSTRPGGFVWDARVPMGPGLAVLVRDGFVHGTGSMRAKALGLVTVVSVEGTPEIAAAALQRWLAEAAWYPTALLPAGGARWTALDERRARVEVEVAGVPASIVYHFGDDGLVERVFTPARGREVDGRSVPTPWEGVLLEWGERGGLRVPVRAEVAWLPPEGRLAYWRGRLAGIAAE